MLRRIGRPECSEGHAANAPTPTVVRRTPTVRPPAPRLAIASTTSHQLSPRAAPSTDPAGVRS